MTVSTPLRTGPAAAPTRVLDALTRIIADLAGEQTLEASLAGVLDSLREALEADEAAIWLPAEFEWMLDGCPAQGRFLQTVGLEMLMVAAVVVAA